MKITVIGNGVSRAPIPLDKISGITIGCNEIFEEFTPDYICVVDQRVMKSLYDSNYINPVYYRHKALRGDVDTPKNNWHSPDFLQYNNSGNAALELAIHLGATEIDLLGFDCGPGRLLRLSYMKDAQFDFWAKYLIFKSTQHKGIRRIIGQESTPIPDVPSISVEDYIKSLDK